MAGRGPQSFKKRQKEQARKEKQEEKRAKRLQRKLGVRDPETGELIIEGEPGEPGEQIEQVEGEPVQAGVDGENVEQPANAPNV